MKSIAVLVLAFSVLFIVPPVHASDNNDRPAGVESGDWIPITDRLGFVVIAEKQKLGVQPLPNRQVLIVPSDSISAELMPPKKGYFAVKTPTGWQRLTIS